jgi:Predicted S-adenosylmethionine-dependent methyltransferase involved in cell envelope biogenesis
MNRMQRNFPGCYAGTSERKKIDTTFALRDLIAEALDFLPKDEKKEAIKKSCARTFQALRIDVNNEYEVLEAFMENFRMLLLRAAERQF